MTSPPAARGIGRLAPLATWLLLLLVLANAAGTLLRPINDPDVFWHLRTGEWIWEHRSLPDRFLFVSHPPDSSAVIQRFTMTSYWMAQILFHLAHAAAGMWGVTALRFLLHASLLLTMFLAKEGDDRIFLGLLALAGPVLWQFPVERPQYLSFVFLGLLLLLLRGFRSAGASATLRLRAAALPLLMVVWANCHGGYVVGLGILAVWLAAESAKRLHSRLDPLPSDRYRLLLASGAAAVLVSFLNPNTYHVFEVALLPAWHTRTIQEYRSTIEIFRFYGDPWIPAYWALLGLAVAALALSWRRPDLTDLALVAFTGSFSFFQIRHIPFFVVAAVPLICRRFSAPRISGKAGVAFAAVGLTLSVSFLPNAVAAYRDLPQRSPVDGYQLPVAAADFIQSERPLGRMFNLYSWGGYLLWRLAPMEVLIDGRNSDRDLYEAYLLVLRGERSPVHGLPFWKQYFLNRGIHFTVTSLFDGLSGEVHGLLDNLLADPAWVPVFISPNSAVFAENVPGNRAVIQRHALPRERFYPLALDYVTEVAASAPRYAQARVARGEIQMRLGDGEGALRSFEEALRIAPRQPIARAWAAKLRGIAASPAPR